MVEEEVMMQCWLLWLGIFDDGSGNYASPEHMKVIEHFVNFQYGCGMQSVVVYSLNHDTAAHLGSALPEFSKFGPQLHMYNSVRVHSPAHV